MRGIMSSKEKVLELLELNKGTYTSGEAIATHLQLSRNAVWKAINELRKSGYTIEAVSNKGYMLSNSTDIVSKQGILSYLTPPTSNASGDMITETYSNSDFIHIYDVLDSTNRTAKELAISGKKHGELIVSKSQTLGKGRRDHSFYSPEGGIYMSIILSPDKLPTLDKDVLTAYTGVSVCDAIKELCNIAPRIKPINDLFVDGRKICGILTESGIEFETDLVQWIVIGIGINFDSDISTFPKDLQEIAGSIFAPGQATISKNQLIAAIYKRLIDWENIDTQTIKAEYQKRLISD